MAAPAARKTFRVLSFNIWVGGDKISLEKTAEVIRSSEAALVGLQEVKANGPRLAEMTGMTLYEQGNSAILSRYPIQAESPLKMGVKVELPEIGPVWMFNTHLAASPYQPYQLAGIPYGKENPDIHTAAEAIGEALRARGQQVSRLLMDLGFALQTGAPIVLTGDFNEPSHLDWTANAAQTGKCQLPVPWPTSRAICDAGFKDAWRSVHSNEVTHPGHTWTPVPGKREIHDRIDFVYSHGLEAINALRIGENAENADLVVSPYPSDHRAVLAEFAVPTA